MRQIEESLFDLVMWTKNGAKTLRSVLLRIESVTPNEIIGNRIVVDDKSSDNTVDIAASFGWKVVKNKGAGISDAANTALDYIKTNSFVSFEQDLILAKDWWIKVPRYLKDPKIVIASGMRFASQPVGLRKLQKFIAKIYGDESVPSWLRGWGGSVSTIGKTMDNTIYKTDFLRSIGGFPNLRGGIGIDTILAHMVESSGHKWIVDSSVQSTHLRRGLRHELNHQYLYGAFANERTRALSKMHINENSKFSQTEICRMFFQTMCSPFTGFLITLKTHEPSIFFVHPLIKGYYLKGFIEGRTLHN